MEDILINITPQETRVAVLNAGVVQELHVERSALRGLVGNIYLGRVARVLPGMQSAFIDIGLERAAFLHVADIWEYRQFTQVKPPPIERLIHEGDTVMVQVVKDPIGTKGARLSTQVSLAGRMLVYLPQDPHIGISQRIEDEAERTQLRETLKRLVPPDEKGGYIIRTSAEDADRAGPEQRPRLPARTLGPHPRAPDWQQRAIHALPGALAGPARAARHRDRRDDHDPRRLARKFRQARAVRHAVRVARRAQARALHGRAAAVRPVLDRRRDRARPRSPRGAEVGRLPHHRPDRGDDDDRRQHRRLRRHAQLRRHHLQDQPRSLAGDRAPAQAAQPRRHHHRRFHRHDERRAPRSGADRVQEGAGARPHAHDRQRIHAARDSSR